MVVIYRLSLWNQLHKFIYQYRISIQVQKYRMWIWKNVLISYVTFDCCSFKVFSPWGAHETIKAACISNNYYLTCSYLLVTLCTSYSQDHLCMSYSKGCRGAAMSQRSAVSGMEQSQMCACLCSASPFFTPDISIHHLERGPDKCHGQGSGERWAGGFPGSAHLHRLRLSALFLNWRVLSCLFKHFLFCLVICSCITHSYLPSSHSSPALANSLFL